MITRARKIVTKFHNYSYEIFMSPVIVNSYQNAHNSYQIVKLTIKSVRSKIINFRYSRITILNF